MVKVSDPIKIGHFTVKNRITFAPTVKFDFTDDSGLVTKKLVKHYEERAKGGTGLICVEATAVLPGGRFGKNHMGLWCDEQIEGHKAIVEACHREGAVVIIQLNHTGYSSNPECGEPVGPSTIERDGFMGKYTTKGMSKDEVHDMQKAFTDAAMRAKKAGYDGVQLHGCHGYLINQFVSPENNLRTDEYGGSPENRARFCSEMIEAIRKECGEDFLISVRTTGLDPNVEEAIEVAEKYVKAGCDYLQVSCGMTDWGVVSEYKDPNINKFQSFGVRFKDYFKDRIPISTVGDINTPKQVKYIIENGYADTVDLARAILADPGFANAVINDTPYTKCFGCKACQFGPFTKHTCPAEIKRMQK